MKLFGKYLLKIYKIYILKQYLWFYYIVCFFRMYIMARPKGFEPLTHALEGRCSIQLS